MAYTRTYTVDSSPGGDTVKAAVATKLDGDLTNAFTYLNAHDIATTSVHGFTGAKTGSGAMVGANTPTLITPVLGVATATSINGLTITTSTGTVTITNGKVFSCSGTLTLAGTEGSTLNIGTGGTLGTAAYTAATAYEASGAVSGHAALITGVHGLVFTAGQTLTLTTSLTNNTGAGTLTWPAAGATLTIPTGGGTLGSAAFTASTAYDAAGTAAGKIASSVSDGDTTHAPDGNSVFDALALKMALTGANLAIGSDADGDMYYRASGVLARLPKGTTLQQLRMNVGATAPEWAASSSITYATAAEINTGTEAAKAIAPDQFALAARGKLVQVAHAVVTAVLTGATAIPLDDTIPQITEGDEFITCAITPKNANNLLYIMANLSLSNSTILTQIVALFQDAVANALAVTTSFSDTATGMVHTPLMHKMTAGSTSEITFRIRAGGQSAGTTTVNGQSGNRKFGGVSSTTLTIFEYAP